MNKKDFNYVSPVATVKEMHVEGVLCMSVGVLMQHDFGHETWSTGDLSW